MNRSHGTSSVTGYKDRFRLPWSAPEGGRGTKIPREANKKEAETELRKILAALDTGSFHDERKGNITFEATAEDWLAWNVDQVQHST